MAKEYKTHLHTFLKGNKGGYIRKGYLCGQFRYDQWGTDVVAEVTCANCIAKIAVRGINQVNLYEKSK